MHVAAAAVAAAADLKMQQVFYTTLVSCGQRERERERENEKMRWKIFGVAQCVLSHKDFFLFSMDKTRSMKHIFGGEKRFLRCILSLSLSLSFSLSLPLCCMNHVVQKIAQKLFFFLSRR